MAPWKRQNLYLRTAVQIQIVHAVAMDDSASERKSAGYSAPRNG